MAGSKFTSQVEVLSVVDKGRRREWTDAEKVRIVEESLRGYRQCAATARRYEISRALLTRWRRDFRSGCLAEGGRPRFMALQVAAGVGALAAEVPAAVSANGIDDRVEITLANGRRIALAISVDLSVLLRLVQVLDRA
jgi:transposase